MKIREFEPWRVRIREIRIEKGLSYEKIAEMKKMSVDTVANVFNGETRFPRVDTMHPIIEALGCSWDDVFLDTGAVIGGRVVKELQCKLDEVTAERDSLSAENGILKEQIIALTSTNSAITNEASLLRVQLQHKDEIIALLKSLK